MQARLERVGPNVRDPPPTDAQRLLKEVVTVATQQNVNALDPFH
jgi:hypothetical protein